MKVISIDLDAHEHADAPGGWWVVHATCLHCGRPLEHVTTGVPQDGGRRISAIAKCAECPRARYILTVTQEVA